MLAAAYARYSTDRQQETSILVQLQEIKNYCDQHGFELYQPQYVDQAFSGTNTARPAFQQLLADARAHKFEAVVLYDISRGSRDIVDWFAFRRQMQELGISVHSCTNTIGALDDPNAFLSELITAGLGQHMVLQTRQKSIAGKRMRAEQGLFCGGFPPIGYDIIAGKYTINEKEAALVRTIFEMYVEGCTYPEIIDAVTKSGYRTRTGKELAQNSLHDILKNQRYTGKYIWFEKEERHMHKHVGRAGDAIMIEGAIPRIISDELFERAQQRMSERIIRRRGKRDYLLSGVIKCGLCGASLYGSTVIARGREYRRYTCINRYNPEHKCPLAILRADPAEEAVMDILRRTVLNRATLEATAQAIIDRYNELKAGADKIRAEIESCSAKLYRLYGMQASMPEPSEELSAQILHTTEQKKSLERELSEAECPLEADKDEILQMLEEDCASIESNAQAMREIVLSYIKQVTVTNDNFDVEYYLISGQNKSTPCENGVLSPWLPRYESCLHYNISISRESLGA